MFVPMLLVQKEHVWVLSRPDKGSVCKPVCNLDRVSDGHLTQQNVVRAGSQADAPPLCRVEPTNLPAFALVKNEPPPVEVNK